MRAIKAAIVVALAAWLGAPGPAAADGFGLRADLGGVRIGIGSGHFGKAKHFRKGHFGKRKHYGKHRHRVRRGLHRHPRPHRREPLLFGSGPVNDFARDARRRAQLQRHRPRRRIDYDVDVVVPFDYFTYSYPDGYVEEGREFIERGSVVPEVEHVPEPDIAAPEPPDIGGPRFETARGLRPYGPAYAVGRPLPPTLPYVVLDWRDYDLPTPPDGEIYVRFAGDVLRIESIERVVTEVIWPPQD